jgi:homoserine acetyltransferase
LLYAIKDLEETCFDGIKNQDELQVDCGGRCSPCSIEYHETGTYGLNLLYGNDTLLVSGTGNSFS